MIFAAVGLTLNLFPLLAALAVMAGAGSLLARFLAPVPSTGSEFQHAASNSSQPAWGWSFLLGMAFVGLGLQLPLAIDGRITHRSYWIILTLSLSMALLEVALRWRDSRAAPTATSIIRRFTGWFCDLPLLLRMLVVLCLANFIWFSAVESPVTFDARSIYGMKARLLYDAGDLKAEDFRNPDRVHFNANYPLMIPLVESFLYFVQGSQQDLGIQLLFAGVILALASILIAEISRFETRRLAAVWGAGFILLPIVLAPAEGTGLSGSADFTFAAFITAGVIALGQWFVAPRTTSAVLAGLMLGAAISTKQEGLVWLLAIAASMLVASRGRTFWPQRQRLISATLSAATISGCMLLVTLNRQGIPNSPYVRAFATALHWDWIVHTWSRIPYILIFALEKLNCFPLFSFVWPLIAAALLLLPRSRPAPTIRLWRITALCMVAGYVAIFTFSPLHLDYQLKTAFYRLTVHILPLFLLIAAEHLAAAGWSRQLEWMITGKTSDHPNLKMHSAVVPNFHAGLVMLQPPRTSVELATVAQQIARPAHLN
jgi:hypothetical protein